MRKTDMAPPMRILAALATAVIALPAHASDDLRVDGARLNQTMAKMKTFGQASSGGSDRVAFSDADLAARKFLGGLMAEAGLSTHVDFAGNLVARRDGTLPGLAPLVSGSHTDTVPNGGHYDGIVGVMSAIEVARTLHDAGVELAHPLEIVVWTNEEAGKTGSRSIDGSVLDKEFALRALGEKTIGEGLRFLGGDPDRLVDNERSAGDIAAYVELHVEQGAVLDGAGIEIGVVDGIVGIKRWNVTVDGFANHAGSTPMDQRQDAMFAAARFVTDVRRIITERPGGQVGTVGRIQAFPGAPNVIPGRVIMSLEIRDLDMRKIDNLFAGIENAARAIGEETTTEFGFEQYYFSPAAISDERISKLVEDSATALELTSKHMPSGAGHDAQSIATIAPMGMIFVPSSKGISHAPGEFTSERQIADGANVLLHTLIGLDELLR